MIQPHTNTQILDRRTVASISGSDKGKLAYDSVGDISKMLDKCLRISQSRHVSTSRCIRQPTRKPFEGPNVPATETRDFENMKCEKSQIQLSKSERMHDPVRQDSDRMIELVQLKLQYEKEVENQLKAKLKQFEKFESDQLSILGEKYQQIESRVDKKASEIEESAKSRASIALSQIKDANEKVQSQQKQLQIEREKRELLEKKLALEKEEKLKAELAHGKTMLKAMLDLFERDTKLYQEVLSDVKSCGVDMRGQADGCFEVLLEIVKQAHSNMRQIIQFSQSNIREVRREHIQAINTFSKDVNEALAKISASLKKNISKVDQISQEINSRQIQPEHRRYTSTEVMHTDNGSHAEVANKPKKEPSKKVEAKALERSEFFSTFSEKSSEAYIKYEAILSSKDPRSSQFVKVVKGACRSINNAISGNSLQMLTYQTNRIMSLFRGKTVSISDVLVNPNIPNGIEFIKVYLAENLVANLNQFDCRELALATLLVELALHDNEFRSVLMSAFHRRCPFTRPAYPSKRSKQSEDEFKVEVGYTKQLGEWEDTKSYLNRMLYMVQLYGAVLTTRPISGDGKSSVRHPYGYGMAWTWLAEFINLTPFSGYSAGLLRAFLSACGSDLLQQYSAQFVKMMRIVKGPYLDRCKKIKDDMTYIGHLENSLGKFFTSGSFFKDCELDSEFWG